MSRALVIKGANFSANKVETVTLGEVIPCTGITLSQTAITAPTFGSTIQLTATLTPTNTTDEVIWSASNDAATVSSTGLVTITGVGDVTITAQCGTETATCTISSITHTVNFSDLDYINVAAMTGLTDLSTDPPKDIVGGWANSKGRIYCDESNPKSGYVAPVPDDTKFDSCYPIALPGNASSVKVTFTGGGVTGSRFVFVNANESYTYPEPASNYRSHACKATSNATSHNSVSTYTENVPAGSNGFIFDTVVSSASDISAVAITGSILFS